MVDVTVAVRAGDAPRGGGGPGHPGSRGWGRCPRLVVGDRYLIGSGEIPDEFPGIVEAGLAGGGIDWPGIPGMAEALAGDPPGGADDHQHDDYPAPPTSTTGASSTTVGRRTSAPDRRPPPPRRPPPGSRCLPGGDDSMWDRFRRDETANSLALVVLGLMLLSVVGAAVYGRRSGSRRGGPGRGRAPPRPDRPGGGDLPGLRGDQWDRGGVRPGGRLQRGAAERVGPGVRGHPGGSHRGGRLRRGARPPGPWLASGRPGVRPTGPGWPCSPGRWPGWRFSVYLTFLEPFVIGATCMWCLGSAVVVTLLLWLTARPGVAAWRRVRGRRGRVMPLPPGFARASPAPRREALEPEPLSSPGPPPSRRTRPRPRPAAPGSRRCRGRRRGAPGAPRRRRAGRGASLAAVVVALRLGLPRLQPGSEGSHDVVPADGGRDASGRQGHPSPRSMAHRVNSLRLVNCSLRKTSDTWVSTVRGERLSESAVSL